MLSDLTKYKRFFAFGCSFTSHCHPTWADILSSEMPDAEYYNFGQGGSGNLMISNRVAQANLKFNFNEDDLVIVMFSTMCREDRYIDGWWRTNGNIYNQRYYDKKFVKKYCDPIGFVVRDMALLEMTQSYLNALPCQTVFLSLADMSYEAGLLTETTELDFDNEPTLVKLKQTYNELNFPSVVDSELFGFEGITLKDKSGKKRRDGHPTTQDHLDFLLKHDFPISDTGKNYVTEMMSRVEKVEYWDELYNIFPEMNQVKTKSNLVII